jgi:hypothetical protein
MKSPPFGVKNVISRFYHTRLYNNHIQEFFIKSLITIQDMGQILIHGC